MGKSKNKTHSELEYLRGIIKKLRSENKKLKQQLKESSVYEEIADEVIEDVDVNNTCENCGKGVLQEIDLNYIVLIKCDVCEYKDKRKPNEKKTSR